MGGNLSLPTRSSVPKPWVALDIAASSGTTKEGLRTDAVCNCLALYAGCQTNLCLQGYYSSIASEVQRFFRFNSSNFR